jgi:uncharacterized membrane protein AbrB (regulator of aidB expression)
MRNPNDINELYENMISFFVLAVLLTAFSTAMLWAMERERYLGIWDKSSERILVQDENK